MSQTKIICRDAETLAERGADIIIDAAREAIEARGKFSIALSGGSTPEQTFKLLAHPERSRKVDWANVHIFMGDDRYVAYDDPSSNFGMAKRSLLDHVPLNPAHLFPVDVSIKPSQKAALDYQELLVRELGEPPVFDLALQGMGGDGHTASLFPHSANLDIQNRWVVDSPPGILPPPVDRVTVTFPVLNSARIILMMISGKKKASVLKAVLEGGADFHDHPSAGLKPRNGKMIWLLDEAAAELLSER